MQPLNRAINTAGKCAIPLTLVVLGAYFHEPSPEEENGKRMAGHQTESTWRRIFSHLGTKTTSTPVDPSQPTKQRRPGETKTVVLAILARMVLTPLLLVPFLMLAARYDWHAVFEECVFVFRMRLPPQTKSFKKTVPSSLLSTPFCCAHLPPSLLLKSQRPYLAMHLRG
jgi:hypothetical protein